MHPATAQNEHTRVCSPKHHSRLTNQAEEQQKHSKRHCNIPPIDILKYFPKLSDIRPTKSRRTNSLDLTPREPVSLSYLRFYKQQIPILLLSDEDRSALLFEVLKLDYEHFLSTYSIEIDNLAKNSYFIRPQEEQRHSIQSLLPTDAGLSDHSEKRLRESNNSKDSA